MKKVYDIIYKAYEKIFFSFIGIGLLIILIIAPAIVIGIMLDLEEKKGTNKYFWVGVITQVIIDLVIFSLVK